MERRREHRQALAPSGALAHPPLEPAGLAAELVLGEVPEGRLEDDTAGKPEHRHGADPDPVEVHDRAVLVHADRLPPAAPLDDRPGLAAVVAAHQHREVQAGELVADRSTRSTCGSQSAPAVTTNVSTKGRWRNSQRLRTSSLRISQAGTAPAPSGQGSTWQTLESASSSTFEVVSGAANGRAAARLRPADIPRRCSAAPWSGAEPQSPSASRSRRPTRTCCPGAGPPACGRRARRHPVPLRQLVADRLAAPPARLLCPEVRERVAFRARHDRRGALLPSENRGCRGRSEVAYLDGMRPTEDDVSRRLQPASERRDGRDGL